MCHPGRLQPPAHAVPRPLCLPQAGLLSCDDMLLWLLPSELWIELWLLLLLCAIVILWLLALGLLL